MNKPDKIQISLLCDLYGGLLTEKQYEAVRMYCDCDCSLQETAEQFGITRQGVRDALMSAETALLKFDEVLNLSSKRLQIESSAQKILQAVREGDAAAAENELTALTEII